MRQERKGIYEALKPAPKSDDAVDMPKQLHRELVKDCVSELTNVLTTDEAQVITIKTLEKFLQIMPVGQPEVEEELHLPRLRALKQRITTGNAISPAHTKGVRPISGIGLSYLWSRMPEGEGSTVPGSIEVSSQRGMGGSRFCHHDPEENGITDFPAKSPAGRTQGKIPGRLTGGLSTAARDAKNRSEGDLS